MKCSVLLVSRRLRVIAFVAILFAGWGISGAAANAQAPADDPDLQVRLFDILELANGQVLEGEILDDRDSEVVFRQRGGIQSTLPRRDISKILLKNPPEAVYETRVDKYFSPDRFEDQVELGRWCLEERIGLTEKGILHLELATALRPGASELYEELLPLYRRRDATSADTDAHDRELSTCLLGVGAEVDLPGLSIRTAELLVGMGDARAAILMLQQLGETDAGGNLEIESAQDFLASLLESEGRREEARTLVDRWLTTRDPAGALRLLRLRSGWLLEDAAAGVEGAAEALEDVIASILEEAPEDGLAHLHRGALQMLQEDFTAARSSFGRAFELGEVGAEAAVTYALNFARGGEPRKALELISMARNAPSVQEQVRLTEAYARENLGDAELAADLLEEVVNLPDASWQAHVLALQGRTRLSEGFPLERGLKEALERFGDNPAAFAELSALMGDAFLRDGELDEARRWLGYAVSAGRAVPEVLLRLGLAELGAGDDLRAARGHLEDAVANNPDDPDIQNALGCLEYRSGDLERARERFETVLRLRAASRDENAAVPAGRKYALAALEQITRTLGEEVWSDAFQRPDGSQILNNWAKKETFGINITLRDGSVHFSGTQKFQADGLTILQRPVEGSTLARLRARIRIPRSGVPARVGLRLEGERGDGIVVFRDLDGMLGISLNSSQESTVIRTDSTGDEAQDLTMVPTLWPDDDRAHWLELRLPLEDDDDAAVYLDGAPVIQGIPAPQLRGRGSPRIGVSGQADLDRTYSFELEELELFRKRPKREGSSRF